MAPAQARPRRPNRASPSPPSLCSTFYASFLGNTWGREPPSALYGSRQNKQEVPRRDEATKIKRPSIIGRRLPSPGLVCRPPPRSSRHIPSGAARTLSSRRSLFLCDDAETHANFALAALCLVDGEWRLDLPPPLNHSLSSPPLSAWPRTNTYDLFRVLFKKDWPPPT